YPEGASAAVRASALGRFSASSWIARGADSVVKPPLSVPSLGCGIIPQHVRVPPRQDERRSDDRDGAGQRPRIGDFAEEDGAPENRKGNLEVAGGRRPRRAFELEATSHR